jgi:hypothetical protein
MDIQTKIQLDKIESLLKMLINSEIEKGVQLKIRSDLNAIQKSD